MNQEYIKIKKKYKSGWKNNDYYKRTLMNVIVNTHTKNHTNKYTHNDANTC